MSWNYRVLKSKDGDNDLLRIVEAYYNSDGELRSYGEASAPVGETLEEIQNVLDKMKTALDKPIISIKDFD